MESKELIDESQHGFTNGNLCLANLVALYKGIMALVDKGRANDMNLSELVQTFDTVQHGILVSSWRDMDLIMDNGFGG